MEQKRSLKAEILKNKQSVYFHIAGTFEEESMPDEIAEMKKLVNLSIYQASIRSISPKIGELKDLDTFSLHAEHVREMPKEIKELKKLSSLYIHTPLDSYDFLYDLPGLECLVIDNCGLKAFPEAIKNMKELRVLNLSNNDISDYPNWMLDLEQLENLNLSDNPLKNIDFSKKNASLEKIEIRNCQLSSLPESIEYLSNLEYLYVYKNQLTILPQAINKLKKLEGLNVDKNPMNGLPEDLSGLVNLKYFQFEIKWMADYPPALLQLPALLKLPKSKQVPERALFIPALARECQKKEYEIDYRLFLLDVLAERKEKLKKNPKYRQYLCEAMNCGLPLIQSSVLDLVSASYQESTEKLQKGAIISVVGNSSFNLNELKERLKNLGLGYSAKPDAKTTHIVLGKLPKKAAALAADEKYTILTEQILVDYLNKADTPYLLEEATQSNANVEHLSSLLLSGQEDNIQLALQMMQGGGVPSELITDLLIVYFRQENKKIRQAARKLLEHYGPTSLLPSYSQSNAPERFIFEIRDVSKFHKYFEPLCEEHGLDKIKILNALLEEEGDYGYGIVKSYLLKFLPEKEALILLKEMVSENGELNFSDYLMELIPEQLLANKELTERVVSLVLDSCFSKELPNFLLKYKNLKRLDLSSNNLVKLPAEFGTLSELEELNLDFNNFKEIPPVIFELKKLKDLRFGFMRVKKLPEALAKMESLRNLEMVNCNFESVPEVLYKMTQLEELNIHRTFQGVEYPKEAVNALKKALPNCKILKT